MLSKIKYDKVVLYKDEDIMLKGDQIMNEFDKIKEEMKKQRITPRIRYELMAIRALKVVAVLLIGAGIVWLMAK